MAKKRLTKNQKRVIELKDHLKTLGFEETSYGHMQIRIGRNQDRQLRFKFQKTSVRTEVKPDKDREGNKWTHGWIKRWSAYIKDVEIAEDGRVKPLKTIK
jgi:hypothetical protein